MTNYKWNQVKESDHDNAPAADVAITVGSGVFVTKICDVIIAMTLTYYNMRVKGIKNAI